MIYIFSININKFLPSKIQFKTSFDREIHMSSVAISLKAVKAIATIFFSFDYKSHEILFVAKIKTSFFS